MMLEYKFKDFWNKYQSNKIDIQRKFFKLRFFEDSINFILMFRDEDYIDVYTIVSKNKLNQFADISNISLNEAIIDFRNNYLVTAEQVLTNPIKTNSVKSFTKTIDDPGEEVVEESKDYAEFMSRIIKGWESKVLKGIDNIDKSVYTKKTFGEFLSQMMNTVNSLPFMKGLKRYVKDSFVKGIEAGENETGVQIGFSASSEDKVKALQHQELNGYTLPDGKAWHGIKGATKEMQFNILKTVQEGVKNKQTKTEIKEDVKKIFKTASDASADRIARTETTRFISEGKLTAFKESGVEGYKVWKAVNDDRTSTECRKLNGTKAEYDDPFYDSKGVSHQYPPQHSNCRCVIEFALKE